MITSNDVSSQLDWRPEDGRLAFHFAVQRFFANLVTDLFPQARSVATHLSRDGADISIAAVDQSDRGWKLSLKVSPAPGLLPPSLYSEVMTQFYRWKITGDPGREHWLLVTNYFLEPEMEHELTGLGVSCFCFRLDESMPAVRRRLSGLIAKLSQQPQP